MNGRSNDICLKMGDSNFENFTSFIHMDSHREYHYSEKKPGQRLEEIVGTPCKSCTFRPSLS